MTTPSDPCDCELRNRAWNPNTGRCKTCGRRYEDPRRPPPAERSVREKLAAGEYKTQIPYPYPDGPANADARRVKLRAFRADESRLVEQMKLDLFAEYHVRNNPKAQRCWEISWERGHDSGLMSVLDVWDELVELIS